MKVISLQPPWGWLMVHGAELPHPKDMENRGWRSNFTGRIIIHQSKTWDPDAEYVLPRIDFGWYIYLMENEEVSHAYGLIGELTFGKQVTKASSPWFFGPYAWPASDPLPYARTLPWPGQLGIFEVPDHVIEASRIITEIRATEKKGE